MSRTSYRFLLGASLLAAGVIALVIFSLGLDENAAKPDTSGVKSRIFFDNDPRVVAYQLGRLSNDQLARVERDTGDPKYRPAWWETSARLFSYLPVRWVTDGKTSRWAAG